MANSEEIENLLAKVSLGDRLAYGQLYDLAAPRLFGVCLRVLDDHAAAEDALQEVWMKIWRYADRYATGGSARGWLISIARNTAIDKRRALRPSDDLDEMAERLPAEDPTPEQSAVAIDELGQITACLNALDDPRDKAVRGAYLEGLSYAELARKFDVPLNTVRTWLRRSLLSLKECMGQ
jgi:RNA polymerase sigma-70 factor (ECF subfamily)